MESRRIDILAIVMVLVMYIAINIFSMFSKQYYFENLLMLSLTFALILLAYFSGIIVGLSASVISIFFYGSYVLYQNVIQGKVIDYHVYVWLMLLPLLTILSALVGAYIRSIQYENEKLKKDYSSYVTVDPKTGLGNVQVFFTVLNQYINLSKRTKLPLTLLLVKLMYFEDIKNIAGNEGIEEVLREVGHKLVESTRIEDCSYVLEDGKTFAILLFTDIKGAQIVKSRIRESSKNFNLRNSNKVINIKIELKIGIAQYDDEEVSSAMALRKAAEKDMEYDV
ncbi:GGDEF domain-containing protein [Clostridium oryzae]|uniref:Response regulator PleD n=1 Tax=Clostridium oryzae TaxID=1450648 RepID=A0A1V4IEJ7_9CLOT|nr:diguanylate cyclase [Clostridium oryzae]OPJ58270.1 response regulator PleD [Clostridium oryzae]